MAQPAIELMHGVRPNDSLFKCCRLVVAQEARGGVFGAPVKSARLRFTSVFAAMLIALATILLERFVLGRIPAARNWLGLVNPTFRGMVNSHNDEPSESCESTSPAQSF
jgi:hypothetical protein